LSEASSKNRLKFISLLGASYSTDYFFDRSDWIQLHSNLDFVKLKGARIKLDIIEAFHNRGTVRQSRVRYRSVGIEVFTVEVGRYGTAEGRANTFFVHLSVCRLTADAINVQWQFRHVTACP